MSSILHSGSPTCSICRSASLEFVRTFEKLPRVSSDCRPFPAGGELGICGACGAVQKPDTTQWRADCSRIYGAYEMFRQAQGHAEQAIFDADQGVARRRSEVLLDRLRRYCNFDQPGRVLDVGCGNGPTLRVLSESAPSWALYGHEISDASEPALRVIPGFRHLYSGELRDLPGGFDLIVLSHALEHMPDPVLGLAALREKLTPTGYLFVQVPDARVNTFDLIVADHRSHFDRDVLSDAAKRAGLSDVVVADDWVGKELSLVASHGMGRAIAPRENVSERGIQMLAAQVEWLGETIEAASDVARRSARFGLFGTAIAATWLFGALRSKVDFFVDEDPSRVGQEHERRPILSPHDVPRGATVFVPLLPAIAKAATARLAALNVLAHGPPEFDLQR